MDPVLDQDPAPFRSLKAGLGMRIRIRIRSGFDPDSINIWIQIRLQNPISESGFRIWIQGQENEVS
jgi:hypothetical protein